MWRPTLRALSHPPPLTSFSTPVDATGRSRGDWPFLQAEYRRENTISGDVRRFGSPVIPFPS